MEKVNINDDVKNNLRKKEYFDNCIKLLKEGINLGKLDYKKREELYN